MTPNSNRCAAARDLIQNLRGKYKGKKLLAALAAEKKRAVEISISEKDGRPARIG